MPPESPAVEVIELTRVHHDGQRVLHAVDCVSLSVGRGEVVAVTGPSGSGKTTLLQLIGGLDRPDYGRIKLAGVDWHSLRGAGRARFRRRNCGFVLQGSALLPQASAAENVEASTEIADAARRERLDDTAHSLAHLSVGCL